MKDLSMHIMDIVQNSISAGANLIEIRIRIRKDLDLYLLDILDNGKGMNEEMLSKVTDPFFTTRTTRKVGMGIPLLKMNAERTGGKFTIESTPGKGTSVRSEFKPAHPDMLPEGDLERDSSFALSFKSGDSLYLQLSLRKEFILLRYRRDKGSTWRSKHLRTYGVSNVKRTTEEQS